MTLAWEQAKESQHTGEPGGGGRGEGGGGGEGGGEGEGEGEGEKDGGRTKTKGKTKSNSSYKDSYNKVTKLEKIMQSCHGFTTMKNNVYVLSPNDMVSDVTFFYLNTLCWD